MYRMTENQLILPDDFFLPFGGKLNKENRWVILTSLIPWWKAEEKYAKTFKKNISRTEVGFCPHCARGLDYPNTFRNKQQRNGRADHGKSVLTVLYRAARLSGTTAVSPFLDDTLS